MELQKRLPWLAIKESEADTQSVATAVTTSTQPPAAPAATT